MPPNPIPSWTVEVPPCPSLLHNSSFICQPDPGHSPEASSNERWNSFSALSSNPKSILVSLTEGVHSYWANRTAFMMQQNFPYLSTPSVELTRIDFGTDLERRLVKLCNIVAELGKPILFIIDQASTLGDAINDQVSNDKKRKFVSYWIRYHPSIWISPVPQQTMPQQSMISFGALVKGA